MAAEVQYKCDPCGRPLKRHECIAKKVAYTTMGSKSKTKRMRTVAWLCEDCMKGEPEYNAQYRGRQYLKDEAEIAS